MGGMEADPELGLMYRDISEFKDTEIPKAIGIIQAVARQINGELSAKRKKGGHSGKLDFRKTIRAFIDKLPDVQRSAIMMKYFDDMSVNEHDITLDAELISDLGLNSLELADLAMLCEERFELEFDEEELKTLLSVRDVVNYLELNAND